MELTLTRHTLAETYTEGNLTFDSVPDVIPTTEDRVRTDGVKVPSETAIPAGRYKVSLDIVSPKFSRYPFYMEVCNGKLPRLLDVPNFTGILFHCGVDEDNSDGCILTNRRKRSLEEAKKHFRRLMEILYAAPDKDDIWITVK